MKRQSLILAPILAPILTPILAAAMALAICLPASAAAPAQAGAGDQPATVGSDGRVSVKTALYEFDYAYPPAAARIPALKAVLDGYTRQARAEIVQYAREEQQNARQGGYEYRPGYQSITWQVVTELAGWLSLSATYETYSGGAHPNHGYDGLLWDKRAGRQRQVWDLFTSKAALRKAIRADFCREIDKQREERRGEKITPGSDDPFEVCIDPMESTVILGSSTRKAFDRIGVLVAPYAAGPYVEGDYEVTLPVTAKVLALVRPQYRKFFAVKR